MLLLVGEGPSLTEFEECGAIESAFERKAEARDGRSSLR